MKIKRLMLILLVFVLAGAFFRIAVAQELVFKEIWKSPPLTEGGIEKLVTADINGNKTKEIIVADFGFEYLPKNPIVVVIEYNGKTFEAKWQKKWHDIFDERNQFNTLQRMVDPKVWTIFQKTVLEIHPPFFMLEWVDGKYVFHEQYQEGFSETNLKSWVWNWPEKDHAIAQADLNGDGKDEIITFERFKANFPEGIMRVRRMEPGFPVIWKTEIKEFFYPAVFIGQFSPSGRNELYAPPMLLSFIKDDQYKIDWIPLRSSPKIEGLYSSLDYSSAGSTSIKNKTELWVTSASYGGKKPLVRFTPNQAGSEFVGKQIPFKSHNNFLGIARLALGDLDNDGLDEVVFSEGTGRLGPEDPEGGRDILDLKEYLHVLKWDGKKYNTVWISKPFLGNVSISQILVDDVTGDGIPEIVVATGKGTLHIFQKE